MTAAITVIIVSYNTAQLTTECIAWLQERCTAVPFDIVVVDNASTDGSAAAVAAQFRERASETGRRLPGVRVERLPVNVGFARAVNHAAALASTPWLLLLNPDTEPDGDVLAAFHAYALAHPDRGIYTGRTLDPDGTDDLHSCHGLPSLWGYFCFATGLSTMARRVRWLNPDELPGLDRGRPARVPAASGCAMFLRRELFDALGGFEPDYFMYSEDIDLCARAAAVGARPTLVPQARVIHRNGASSTSVAKRVMVLRGKCTYLRLRWSRPRAAVARALLVGGIGLRALGSRLTGRARYWREVWAQRSVWLPGWPSVASPGTGTSANAASVRSA